MVQEEAGSASGAGIGKKIDELNRKMNIIVPENMKEKKVRFPKISRSKLKKNYIMVFIMKTNTTVDVKILPIEDNTIYLYENKTYHISTSDYIWRYKNLPCIFLPEFDLKPISPAKLMNEAINEKTLALPQKVIMQLLYQAKLQPKKKPLNMGIILIIILAIAGVVVVMNMFKKK